MLVDIENKVIWELENWKKAEEAKFMYELKQKEVDFLKKWQAERKEKEVQRERIFKDQESKLSSYNQQIQKKLNELLKRENKLVLLEEELKQRINEASRHMATKDKEIDVEREGFKEANLKLSKQNKVLEKKIQEFEKRYTEIVEEFEQYRKDQESSPISIVKDELNKKLMEIGELKSQLLKNDEIKEEYRKHFERLKNEVVRLKKEVNLLMIIEN